MGMEFGARSRLTRRLRVSLPQCLSMPLAAAVDEYDVSESLLEPSNRRRLTPSTRWRSNSGGRTRPRKVHPEEASRTTS